MGFPEGIEVFAEVIDELLGFVGGGRNGVDGRRCRTWYARRVWCDRLYRVSRKVAG